MFFLVDFAEMFETMASGGMFIVSIVFILGIVAFFINGGIGVNYAIATALAIVSIIFFLKNILLIVKSLKENKRKAFLGFILLGFLIFLGCIIQFHGIYTHIRISKIFSIFIPQFIFSFVFFALYDKKDDYGFYMPSKITNIKEFKNWIICFIKNIWNFLFHRLFGISVLILLISVFFSGMIVNDEEHGGAPLYPIYNFIINNFTYEDNSFDKERENWNSKEEIVLSIIDTIRKNMYIDNEFKTNNGIDTNLDEEEFFIKILLNRMYENYTKSTGYIVSKVGLNHNNRYSNGSDYIFSVDNCHIYYLVVLNQKNYNNIFYKYNYTNNTLDEISEEQYYNSIKDN